MLDAWCLMGEKRSKSMNFLRKKDSGIRRLEHVLFFIMKWWILVLWRTLFKKEKKCFEAKKMFEIFCVSWEMLCYEFFEFFLCVCKDLCEWNSSGDLQKPQIYADNRNFWAYSMMLTWSDALINLHFFSSFPLSMQDDHIHNFCVCSDVEQTRDNDVAIQNFGNILFVFLDKKMCNSSGRN